jgi:hypothetical protein
MYLRGFVDSVEVVPTMSSNNGNNQAITWPAGIKWPVQQAKTPAQRYKAHLPSQTFIKTFTSN